MERLVYAVTTNLCNWHCSILSLGLLSHCIVISKSSIDQGLRCTDKDQSEETEALISAITFLSTTFLSYSLTKPVTCFSCESLALQDYNN